MIKGKGYQRRDVGHRGFGDLLVPLRTVDVVAYARVCERAERRAFGKKGELAMERDEM